MGETVALVLQGGAVTVFLLAFAMIIRGDLRTKQEVEFCSTALARAYAQNDALLAAQAKHLLAINEALTMVAEIRKVQVQADGDK